MMKMRVKIAAAMVSAMCAATVAYGEEMTVIVRDTRTGAPVKGVVIQGALKKVESQNGTRVSVSRKEEDLGCKETGDDGKCCFEVDVVDCAFGFGIKKVPTGYYYRTDYEMRPATRETWKEHAEEYRRPFVFYVDPIVAPTELKLGEVSSRDDQFRAGREVVSYDLVKGEWMPPLGHGETADMTFTRLPREIGALGEGAGGKGRAYSDRLGVSFPGEGNGVVEMKMNEKKSRIIYEAPSDGFQKTLEYVTGLDAKMQWLEDKAKNANLVFRIRVRMNEKGEIVSAQYGKIPKGLKIHKSHEALNVTYDKGMKWNERAELRQKALAEARCNPSPTNAIRAVAFKYYLNPKPMDRNLEER